MIRPRRLLRFVLPVLIAVPLAAHAAASFIIDPVSATTSTRTVRLSVKVDDPYGGCGRGLCVQTTSMIKITPCPPGDPCTNGSYQFTLGSGEPRYMELPLGTTYSLEGSVHSDIAHTFYGDGCRYTCFNDQIITPRTYSTDILPINGAQLNVAVTSASVDTVWIELSASGFDTQKCTEYCGYSVLETNFEVSPCALAAPLTYLCQNGVTTGEISAPRKLALKPGVTYTIWAGFARYGFSYSIEDHACTNQACLYSERTPDLVYTPVLTATTPITWGAVKAMYRSP